jgi:DNA-binding NarL/FixJ family response regulator
VRSVSHLSSSGIERSISEYSSIPICPPSSTAANYVNSNVYAHDASTGEARRSGPDSAFEADRDDTASTKPAILLIHPRPFHRECFARCLQNAYNDHVVFSFGSIVGWRNSAEALALTPSVAIIVIESADASDPAELKLEDAPDDVPIIVVSDIEDSDQIVRTLRNGARGYIPTNMPFSIAVEAVRLVGAGGVFVPASSFVHRERPSAPAKSGVTVTKREMSVIEEIRRGKANKQIAYDLNISEHTVKLHLRRIMKKLKARNRTEVAILARNAVTRSKD